MGCLPLVDGAVSAGKSVGLGIFKSVQDGLVLGVEGDAKREGDKIEKNRKRVFLIPSFKDFIFNASSGTLKCVTCFRRYKDMRERERMSFLL